MTPRYPMDLLLPGPVLLVEPPDDSDDAPSGPAVLVVPPTHVSETDFEDPYDDGFSNGEGVDNGSALHGGHTTGETRRGSLNGEQRQITTTKMMDQWPDEFKASKMESADFIGKAPIETIVEIFKGNCQMKIPIPSKMTT